MLRKGRIAILTGGGDCPGINAVIRAIAKKAILEYGMREGKRTFLIISLCRSLYESL